MRIIVISSPYEIPDDWDLGRSECGPPTSEQIAELDRKLAEMRPNFCGDCKSAAHRAGSEECPLRFEF